MKARTQQEFAKKWTGGVEIKTGESVAKLTSIDTNKEGKIKLFPDGSTSIRVKLSDLPKVAQRFIKPGMDVAKRFRVRLDEDGAGIETVTPYSGVFRGRATGLGPKTKEGEYRLIERTFNKGEKGENTHLEFLCIYEIMGDRRFSGVELPGFYLHYKFEEDPENDGFTRFNTADTPQASQLHKLQAWAEVHGNILDEDVRWPDDGIILETLEERVLENDREVDLIFEKGYIKTVQPVEDYEDADDDDEESTDIEEVQAKVEELPDFLKEPEDDGVKPVAIKSAVKKSSAKKPAKAKVVDEDDDL